MKEVNLDFQILNLAGIEVSHAGQLFAGLLMSETKGDSVKYFDWAMTLHKKAVISIDSSDFMKLKTLIVETDKLSALAKAPIIKYLETIK